MIYVEKIKDDVNKLKEEGGDQMLQIELLWQKDKMKINYGLGKPPT
jgi:hypothetical protein